MGRGGCTLWGQTTATLYPQSLHWRFLLNPVWFCPRTRGRNVLGLVKFVEVLFSEYYSSASINGRGKGVISSIPWGPFILVQCNYTWLYPTVLRNQLENYVTTLEDVHKSITLFMCRGIKSGLCKKKLHSTGSSRNIKSQWKRGPTGNAEWDLAGAESQANRAAWRGSVRLWSGFSLLKGTGTVSKAEFKVLGSPKLLAWILPRCRIKIKGGSRNMPRLVKKMGH